MKRRNRRTLTGVCASILLIIYLLPHAAAADEQNPQPYLISVKDTGAVGNGTTNDTAAFHKALELAADQPNGAVVTIPPGTYLMDLDDPLLVTSNIKVVGVGNPVLKFTRFPGGEEFGYEAFWLSGNQITLEGITIDANNLLIRGVGVHTGSKDIQIKNCTIMQITQPSNPDHPNYNALLSGILIYGNTNRVTIENSNISHISAIHPNPIARGILVWAEPGQPYARNVNITGNTFSYITPREDADAIYFDKAKDGTPETNSLIQNNQIHHVGKRGIKIAAPGVTIKNNHITNSYNGDNHYRFYPIVDPIPQDMFSGISVYASHVTVTGNVIDGIGSYYAAIEADLDLLTDIIIEKNTISNGATADYSDSNGIRLGNIINFKVADNRIINMKSGIFSPIDSKQSGIISNNTISNVRYGILFLDPKQAYQVSKVKVENNKIAANQNRILSLPNLD
ncbi:right-handed parallel beta-helix repeat-containing protein [Paenibacillus barengoltzii]|uniref:right-handed parallel beta-helix repeat-containing protein n=1 Tax=Paenibacillus barengoltzii TaxID=343517 RepID=UPI002DBBD87F|nr:right-handed parallel beta-helix repeat-containing protein [Paenibacillus barengoltzii]MEC2345023.1 right-handed parallel beta-helix repeat-containing protein [Paenibacillus barengoltzii]